MRLQELMLTHDEQCPELFFRGSTMIPADNTLSFDTYYNGFCYTKYRQYTNVSSVTFSCKFSGKATVQLCVFDGEEKTICEAEYNNEAIVNVKFSELPENGFLYPKLIAITDCAFISGEYSAECNPDPINVCIAICTFKRESFVKRNIELLKSYKFSFISRVFVIDNGNTLDAAALSDDFVIVLPNKNYGGSGGFTRGLIEAHTGGYSHVILMDDDIKLNPEILEKMTAFMSILKPEYRTAHFGTAMLSENLPYMQYELGGAAWDGKRVRFVKHNIDIRSQRALLDNLSGNDINYGAWWSFMMPVSDVDRYGLPYPFFIKIDDVEYGLRTCGNSPIITMNGAAVRHEDFDNKYSMHLEYYNVRNQLVLNAAHNNKPTRNALYRLFAVSFKHLVLYRYDSMPIILKAFNDYLRGVDFFLNCDEEKLNRELMQSVPKLTPLKDIPEWNEEIRNIPRANNNKILTPAAVLTLAGHIIPSFLLKKEVSAAPLSMASAYDTLFRKAVIQYQFKGDTGIVTKRSFAKFAKYSFLVLSMAVKLICINPKAKKSYHDRNNEITSMDFWTKHLGLLYHSE